MRKDGRRKGKTLGALLVLGLMAAGQARAQDFQLIGPKPPPPSATPGEIVPPPEKAKPAPATPDQVILPSLLGIRLVDAVAKIARNGASGSGLMLEDLPLLEAPAIQEKLKAFLGKPLTMGGLRAISDTIIAWYRAHDRPLVDIAFPEQDIDSGVVQAVVTEFRAGKITTVGNQWFSSDIIRGGIRLEPGDAIDTERLREDLNWLNQNPFRKTDAVLEKSEQVGATDIELRTEDRLPVRIYGGYDNTGTLSTGRSRWDLGFNWGNALWLDQQFSYQFTSSSNFWAGHDSFSGPQAPHYMSHAVSDLIPLPWRDKLEFFGYYAQEAPQLGPDFGQVGVNGQASIRYIHPLPQTAWLDHQLQLGYDFKTANNNLAFGGVQVFANTNEIDQFLLIYNGTATDPYGVTTLENDLVYSPGGITARNTDTAFAGSGTDFASANYIYDRISASRLTRLPWEMSWVTRLTAQVTDRNLLPSEELGAGGFDSVRGYEERAVNGSRGLLASEELRSPPFSPLRLLTERGPADEMQLLAFWDFAWVSDKTPQPGERTSVILQSVGVGLRYAIDRYFTARFDYGWQLAKIPGESHLGQLAHVAVTIAY